MPHLTTARSSATESVVLHIMSAKMRQHTRMARVSKEKGLAVLMICPFGEKKFIKETITNADYATIEAPLATG